jgi:signal transduction histidine kinase
VPHTQQLNTIMAQHREAVDRFTFKVCGIVSVLYFAMHWKSPYGWIAYPVALAPIVLNALFTGKDIRIGRFSSKSDNGRTGRWILNFLTNPLFFFLFPPGPGEAFGMYTLIALSAQFEVTLRRNKLLVLAAATIGYTVMLSVALPDHVKLMTKLFQATAFSLIQISFFKIQDLWRHSLRRNLETESRAAETAVELESLQGHATAGIQAKTVLHEIDNLIHAMSFPSNPEDQLKVVQRSIAHIKRIKGIVLTPVNSTNVRNVEVGHILDDVNILIKKYVLSHFVKWQTEIDREVVDKIIGEREGALYCILLNLAKNSIEAMQEAGTKNGKIEFRVKPVNNMITFEIIDNGPGMTDAKAKALQEGKGISSKGEGRGIGMRFIKETCDALNYKLWVSSQPGMGARFVIACPVVACALDAKPETPASSAS